MNTMFTISQYREKIQTAKQLITAASIHDPEGSKLTETMALQVAALLFDYKMAEAQEEAANTSTTSNRRARLQHKSRGPLSHIDYNFTGLSGVADMETHQIVLEQVKAKKLDYIAWRAYTLRLSSYHMTVRDSELVWESFMNTHLENDTEEYERSFYSSLVQITETLELAFKDKLTLDEISAAKRRYQQLLENIQDRIDYGRRNDEEANKKANQNKFAEVIKGAEIVDRVTIEEQLLATYKMLPGNGLVARTWGFEVEVPDAKGVEAPAGVEKGEDGSLRSYTGSDECECDCDDCTYHDCDCDYCDNRREGDDHCGNSNCATCDSAEYRTTGGLQRIISPALYTLCSELNDVDAEKNDSAGTHIHVYAKDLTTNQIGQVLAVYSRLQPLMSIICGREDVNYARNIPMEYIRSALKKRDARIPVDKPRAINTGHLLNNRGTIEFRQMDCNLDANRMTVWAWICRALVTSAKRGMRFNDVLGVTDLVSLIEVFAQFNVLLHDENPEQIVYGSKTDAGQFVLQTHNAR